MPGVDCVAEYGSTRDGISLLDDVVREGARWVLAAALEAEVNPYLADLADQRREDGLRMAVRNGYHRAWQVVTSAGAVEVEVQRVNDKWIDVATGERRRLSSAICHRGRASPRSSSRHCRCWTCTAPPPGTSSQRSSSSSVRRPGSPRPPSRARRNRSCRALPAVSVKVDHYHIWADGGAPAHMPGRGEKVRAGGWPSSRTGPNS